MAETGTNPYLALLQQEQKPPGWAEILQHIGNLGFGLAGGFGQAAATGQPTMAAIGPGLMMGNQLNAQAAHQAEQERMKRLEWQFKAQEHEDKRAERLRKENALAAFAGGGGFNVAPPQGPLLGPTPGGMPTPVTPQGGDYDTRTAALEGGTKKGGMVFNELGSGAFGPYQFMPATWAAVRAQNPSLNLPADITQATREQHDAAHGAFKAGNAQGLQAAGFQPTPENLYLAHRFGLGGATSVLRADPDKPLHEVLPIDWQRQNPDMRGQTAGGFRRLATERMGGSSVPYAVRPDAKPTQYSLMPDDVPFELSSGSMTGPRPTTAEPTFTAPVMPQPTWEKPGDVVPVNPAAWFPPPAAPAQPPPVPGQPGQPPAQPPPGGPNVVQAQATPGPNTPPMAPGGGPAPGGTDAPPQRPVTPMPGPDPAFAAQQRAALVGGLIKPDEYVNNLRQNAMDRYKQLDDAIGAQHNTAMEVYRQQQESRRHQRGIDAQKAAETRKLETELVTVRDRTTNELKSVTKAEAVAGVSSGQFIPLDAESAKRAEEAAALAKQNADRAAANQDVVIDPVTGQPVINEKAVEAKTRISAAQGTDQSSKIQFELAQDAIKRNSDWQKSGAAAGATIRNMDIFNRLSEEVKTGKYAGTTADLKAALKSAGVNLDAWGIPDNVGHAQAMQMLSQRFALEMRQEMPGPMSDGDRKFMERGSISIENDPNANKIMAAWIKGNAERAQDRAKFAREYIRSGDFKTDPAGIDDYVEQKLAQKDYFDHSVLPKEAPAAKTPWELEMERRGKMNSTKPGK